MLERSIPCLNPSSEKEIMNEDESKIAGRKLFLLFEQLRGVDDFTEDLLVCMQMYRERKTLRERVDIETIYVLTFKSLYNKGSRSLPILFGDRCKDALDGAFLCVQLIKHSDGLKVKVH